MDASQGPVTTLHDFGAADPDVAPGRAAAIVPLVEADAGTDVAANVVESLAAAGLSDVLVALAAPPDAVSDVAAWLDGLDAPTTLLWCSGPELDAHLSDAGLDAPSGKGRDVWLALGAALAAGHDRVVLHDGDASDASPADARKLLFPLEAGYDLGKAYYARIEAGRLYGRLTRLFVDPLVATLQDAHDAPVLDYFADFRYALAGECAMTADLAAQVRADPRWGLELGVLGDAHRVAGADGVAQVDLGRYAHEHRGVGGSEGLTRMAEGVGAALFRVLADHGVTPDHETLAARYRDRGESFADRYALDARFNGLAADAEGEREQVAKYAAALRPPERDPRLPAWDDAPLDPATVLEVAERDRRAVAEG